MAAKPVLAAAATLVSTSAVLAAFKGLDSLELDDQVVHHVLSNLPDLQERILSAVHHLEAETAVKKAA